MTTRYRHALLIGLAAALMLFASGCAPLTTGAYADDERRTLGELTDDLNITSGVRARLVRDDEVRARDIEVETRRGGGTLYGHVSSAALEQRAMDLAAGVPGVVAVTSRLVVLEPED